MFGGIAKTLFGLIARSKVRKHSAGTRNRKVQLIMMHRRIHEQNRVQGPSVSADQASPSSARPFPSPASDKDLPDNATWKKRIGQIRRSILRRKSKLRSLSSK
jgi:hypothetical protein